MKAGLWFIGIMIVILCMLSEFDYNFKVRSQNKRIKHLTYLVDEKDKIIDEYQNSFIKQDTIFIGTSRPCERLKVPNAHMGKDTLNVKAHGITEYSPQAVSTVKWDDKRNARVNISDTPCNTLKVTHYKQDTLTLNIKGNVGGNNNPNEILRVRGGTSLTHGDSIPYAKSAPEWHSSPHSVVNKKVGIYTTRPFKNYDVTIFSSDSVISFLDSGIVLRNNRTIRSHYDSAGNLIFYFYHSNQ